MQWSWRQSVSAVAVVLLLTACGGGGPAPTTGTVSGTVTRAAATGSSSLGTSSVSEPADIVPGQFFVVFQRGRPDVQLSTNVTDVSAAAADGFTFSADGSFSFEGVKFEQLRAYPVRSGLALYEAAGLDEAATRDLVAEMRTRSTVREAFPNWILTQLAVPNDPNYLVQEWHYEQLNLPAAWDIQDGTTPLETIHVAVLDTGAFVHPDITWAAVGANFVNWTAGAPAVEEGPITNPITRPGGSDHGTHVAGTIGALSNNAAGVAGVNWGISPIPVKVLAANGSGSFAGIIEGIYWAAGDAHPAYGTHINPAPAHVINMSLGGNITEACPASLNDIFVEVYDLYGAVAVVAAGNEASASDVFFPASCPSVITVGATGPTGARAYYSNFGPDVDVFAPGGDFDILHPALDPALEIGAGILSTVDPAFGSYDLFQGTSMAAPHVAGIVSLMLSDDPDLTLDEIRERLHNASMPLSDAECNVPVDGYDGLDLCGAGLLDAEAALLGTNLTVDQLGAIVYAVRFEDEAPELRLGDLGSLATLAGYSTEATRVAGGGWTYELTDLAPGSYLIVGVEKRNPAGSVGMLDRFGTAEVTVTAGQASTADVVAVPVSTLR